MMCADCRRKAVQLSNLWYHMQEAHNLSSNAAYEAACEWLDISADDGWNLLNELVREDTEKSTHM